MAATVGKERTASAKGVDATDNNLCFQFFPIRCVWVSSLAEAIGRVFDTGPFRFAKRMLQTTLFESSF